MPDVFFKLLGHFNHRNPCYRFGTIVSLMSFALCSVRVGPSVRTIGLFFVELLQVDQVLVRKSAELKGNPANAFLNIFFPGFILSQNLLPLYINKVMIYICSTYHTINGNILFRVSHVENLYSIHYSLATIEFYQSMNEFTLKL